MLILVVVCKTASVRSNQIRNLSLLLGKQGRQTFGLKKKDVKKRWVFLYFTDFFASPATTDEDVLEEWLLKLTFTDPRQFYLFHLLVYPTALSFTATAEKLEK